MAGGRGTSAVAADREAQERCKSPDEKTKLDEFEVLDGESGRSLGKGSFGVVRRIAHKVTGQVYALKTMQKLEVIEGDLIDQVEREIQVQRTLKHENVLRLYRHFEDQECVYLLLEFCAKGELYQLLRTRRGRRFTEPVAQCYFKQVAKGLAYLHSRHIVHRDLKPENLLVTDEDVLKIADFGWCAVSSTLRTTFCGTLDYLAPEMIQGLGHDQTLDVWSLGVLLYEMVVGRPPFQSTDHAQLISKILSAELSIKFPAFVSQAARDLVQRLLQKEPSDRLPLDLVLKHTWALRTLRDAEGAGVDPVSEAGCQTTSVARGKPMSPRPAAAEPLAPGMRSAVTASPQLQPRALGGHRVSPPHPQPQGSVAAQPPRQYVHGHAGQRQQWASTPPGPACSAVPSFGNGPQVLRPPGTPGPPGLQPHPQAERPVAEASASEQRFTPPPRTRQVRFQQASQLGCRSIGSPVQNTSPPRTPVQQPFRSVGVVSSPLVAPRMMSDAGATTVEALRRGLRCAPASGARQPRCESPPCAQPPGVRQGHAPRVHCQTASRVGDRAGPSSVASRHEDRRNADAAAGGRQKPAAAQAGGAPLGRAVEGSRLADRSPSPGVAVPAPLRAPSVGAVGQAASVCGPAASSAGARSPLLGGGVRHAPQPGVRPGWPSPPVVRRS